MFGILCHKGVPWILFRLLEEPELKDDVLDSCLMSRYDDSSSFINYYDDITGEDAAHELVEIIRCAPVTRCPSRMATLL